MLKTLGLPLAIVLGVITGSLGQGHLLLLADTVSQLFINFLKLISMPIIFFSIVSTLTGMESRQQLSELGAKVLKYTLFTTFLAACIGLTLFNLINPAQNPVAVSNSLPSTTMSGSYWQSLTAIIPSNILQPFLEGNVFAVLTLALLISLAVLGLPINQRQSLHHLFNSFFAALMKMASWIVAVLPIAIWSFITLLMQDLQSTAELNTLLLYLICIVSANLIQACVVLPVLLRLHGLRAWPLFLGMWPALITAFWSKSSAAALPIALECAEKNTSISKRMARFSLPLCTTINMNACAAFILITVLFVAELNGLHFSALQQVMWCFVATLAAVGNAGVPMGCYFLASALLAYLDVPLVWLGIILPFYSFLDMLETAINVWSDACVTLMADQRLAKEGNEHGTVTIR